MSARREIVAFCAGAASSEPIRPIPDVPQSSARLIYAKAAILEKLDGLNERRGKKLGANTLAPVAARPAADRKESEEAAAASALGRNANDKKSEEK